ncbi:hypothetical protein ACHAPQ_009222 [Fusarium lateritium]
MASCRNLRTSLYEYQADYDYDPDVDIEQMAVELEIMEGEQIKRVRAGRMPRIEQTLVKKKKKRDTSNPLYAKLQRTDDEECDLGPLLTHKEVEDTLEVYDEAWDNYRAAKATALRGSKRKITQTVC